ncbi:MAG: MerR family transcriptional regulator [Betaproteobacteria bacterium]
MAQRDTSTAGKTFRIGELATLSGRSVHTIRWYESQGLMPGVTRDSGGRRVYDALHVGWLELMTRLRDTGMSIAEMREYTALVKEGKGTLKQRQAQLAAHRERVKLNIAELNLAVKLIDRKLAFYADWIDSGKQPPPWWPSATKPAKAKRNK